MGRFLKMSDELKARIDRGIEENRKGSLILTVKDQNGRPCPAAKASLKQKNHAFLYGANLFMLDELETEEKNRIYRERFPQAFNQATLPFYWDALEPEEGKLRFAADSPKIYRRPAPDLCLDYCRANGITPKAHCLTYFNFTPDWVDPHDVPKMKEKLETRYRTLSERYRDEIHSWEVINELLCTEGLGTKYAFFKEDDVLEWNFALAEKYFPNNELIINEAPYLWLIRDYAYNRSPYYQIIERGLKNGARIDSIALQFHVFWKDKEKEMYDPRRLFDVLDLYGRFGLPIQISEITVPAYSGSAEDEELQADLLEQLYSIWFSHKSVEMITYWNFVDGYAAWAPQGDMTKGENVYYGGLMRFDLTPKPAFERLCYLFNEKWHTEETAIADENGEIQMQGFFGDYQVEIEGKTYELSLTEPKTKKEIIL